VIEILYSVLAASVVGSLHCTSMCGGLVAFATSGARSTRTQAAAVLAYNGARGIGYTTLGAVAGGLGSTLDHAGLRVGVGRVAGAVAALVMIAWGIAKLAELAGVTLRARRTNGIQVPIGRLVARLREKPPAVRAAVVGGCTAALPCGFLHAFLIGAAGTASVLKGALVMAGFFLGTLPAVVGLGLGVELASRSLKRHASLVSALVLVGFGLVSLFGRWTPASLVLPLNGSHPSATTLPTPAVAAREGVSP